MSRRHLVHLPAPHDAMTDAEFIASLVGQLADGWEERIEYHVNIKRHISLCVIWQSAMTPARRKHYECACPVTTEERAKTVQCASLIDQLQEAVTEPVSGNGGDGASGDKPHSNAPGNQEALGKLQEIKSRAFEWYWRLHGALYPEHQDSRTLTAVSALRTLPDWCAIATDSEMYDLVRDVKEDLRKAVRSARFILGYDVPYKMLAESLCGECGGALIVADDASSDVRCIGTPEAAPCGKKYYRWQWIELLDGEGA